VDNNYLDLGMSKSGFIHTLPSGRLSPGASACASGCMPRQAMLSVWVRSRGQAVSQPQPGQPAAGHSLFGWLVTDGWCWFVLREEYCWLVAAGYSWLVRSERKVLLAGG
jgi:hypothetical protein